MFLRRHNLNLVPILRELLRTRNVSRTAELVGLSQSAVSAALSRLRVIFDDPLLVPVGRQMVLTQRGAALVEQTESVYGGLEALLQPPQFDPALQTRRFVVATADYISLLMAPRVTGLMAEQAPHASVAFIDILPTAVPEILNGRVDVAIMPEGVGIDMPEKLDRTFLFEDETVVIASKHLRPFKGKLTLAAYKAAQHAMFQMSPRINPRLAVVGLSELGIEQHNLVLVQQFSALPGIVENTACLALVQRRLAERYQRHFAIELFPPPFPLSTLRFCVFFSRAAARDAGLRWFRGLLDQASPDNT